MNIDFNEQLSIKTDQELIDIYINPDDFQENFVTAAVEELNKRNVNLENFEEEREKKMKIKAERQEKGVPGNSLFLTLAFISAFLGGLMGIIAGYVYSQSKKEGHYFYNEKTRNQGRVMFAIGSLVLLTTLVWLAS
jgi:hypothetical protein